MVSTRGPKYKFSQGERVLCYEPDPTKAKVLYDSKVLDVIEQKGKRGKRTVQYLIHFKGWNASWDRCVGEELVLKDTEHNRQLQKSLAEKAQLQIGTYLYRKERKKGSSGSNTTARKRPRVSDFDDEELNAFSSQEEGDVEEEQSEDVSQANSRSSTGGNSSSCEESDSSSEYNSDEYGPASIHISPILRDRLTHDYELVVCGGRLLQLPCRPNALQVLESCVRHHTSKTIASHSPPPPQTDVQEQVRRLNILREVADGLRVYFDFILRDQLLYENERQQYDQALADGILKETITNNIKQEDDNILNKDFPEDYAHLPSSLHTSQMTKIKREPSFSSKSALESEANSKGNHHSDPPLDWQSVRIKIEENNSPSRLNIKQEFSHSPKEQASWNNQNKLKSISEDKSIEQQQRPSTDSPPNRYSMRESRTSSCNSEAASEIQQDNGNNYRPYNNDGSIIFSQNGDQIVKDSNEMILRISNNVKDKVTNNTDHDNEDMNQDVAKNRINEISRSDVVRVLRRGCIKKLNKTESVKDIDNAVEGNSNSNNISKSNVKRCRRAKRPRLSGRRLRSHRPRSRTLNPSSLTPVRVTPETPNSLTEISNNSESEIPNNQPAPQIEQPVFGDDASSKPGPSKNSSEPTPMPPEVNGGVNDDFKGCLEWRIVPPDYPSYPTAVYGAVHLARLFVKLPEYLSVIKMSESKLELIVEFVEYFAKYLEEHAEWFGESFYFTPSSSDS